MPVTYLSITIIVNTLSLSRFYFNLTQINARAHNSSSTLVSSNCSENLRRGQSDPTAPTLCASCMPSPPPIAASGSAERYLALAGPVRSLRLTQHRLSGALLVGSADSCSPPSPPSSRTAVLTVRRSDSWSGETLFRPLATLRPPSFGLHL